MDFGGFVATLLLGAAGAVLALAVSFFLAEKASGGRRTWGWGLFGPLGWLVAAVIGARLAFEEVGRGSGHGGLGQGGLGGGGMGRRADVG